MNCQNCGAELVPGSSFCATCGTPVGAGPLAASVSSVPPPASGLAIVSLIFGIVSWFALPLIGSLVAIITGHMARSEIKRTQGRIGGRGFTVAGLILGYSSIGLICLAVMSIAMITAFSQNIRTLFSESAKDLDSLPAAPSSPQPGNDRPQPPKHR
jgi:hypothetical protein